MRRACESAEENKALVRRFFEEAWGKGMPAALVMATTRGMLRAVVQSSESPGEVPARDDITLLTLQRSRST
jgi:hypothetical protein